MPIMQHKFQSRFSVFDWFPETFKYPFEFSWLINHYKIPQISAIEYSVATKILGNNRLFAREPVIRALSQAINGDSTYMSQYLFFTNANFFIKYIHHCMLEGVMGGFAISLSYKSILEGLKSDFTNKWMNGNPSLGFDPAYRSAIHLIEESQTHTTEEYTGHRDTGNTGKIKSWNESKIVSHHRNYFNGNDTDR
jgi:hypothetical protein